MKILHTADIHLKNTNDMRWLAFEKVLRVAETESADLLVVSGDMFDESLEAEKLKVALRQILKKSSVDVLIIPGNHDAGSLSSGDYFGERVTILGEPGEFRDFGPVRVVGLPFQDLSGEEVMHKLLELKSSLRDGATNILLYHGELLDMVCGYRGYGDEGEYSYMPLKLAFFDDLGFDYVLAGHFHTNFEVKPFKGGYFIYPGSPVSITRKEEGVRKVNLFEVGGAPAERAIETYHVQEVPVTLDPFSPEDPLEKIAELLRACNANAEIHLAVTGFVNLGKLGMNEKEFRDALESSRTGQVAELDHKWRDTEVVFAHGLFKQFEARLRDASIEREMRSRVRQMAIEAVMEAIHAH